MSASPPGKIAARLALGAVAMTLLVAALGAVSLHRLATLGPAVGRGVRLEAAVAAARWEVTGFVLFAAALSGFCAVWALRALPRRDSAGAAKPSAAPGFPFVDRRGPNRAENVVRPAFKPPSARSAAAPNEWESF